MGLSVGELTGFVDLDSSGVQRGAAAGEAATARMARNVLKQLREIEAENATVKIDGEIDDLRNKIRTAEAYRAHLQSQPWSVEVQAKIDAAERDLAKFNAELTTLAARRVKIQVDIDKDRLTAFGDAATSARGRVDHLSEGLLKLAPAASAFGAAGLIPAVLGAAAAASTLQGAVGLLPAVLFTGATGMFALKVATSGFGDALAAMDDPKKFADAIAKLSPAARSTAVAVRELVPAWKSMTAVVQERLFTGLSEKVSALGKTYIPILGSAFQTVAGSANMAGRGVADMLLQGYRVSDVNSIVGSGAAVWANLLAAVQPIVGALVDIGVVGGGVLAELTSGVGSAAQRFADFIAEARRSGELATWIRTAVDAFGDLFAIVGNVGSLIKSVFTSANLDGAGILQTVRDITTQWAQWAASTEGQQQLGEIMSALKDILSDVAYVIGTIVVAGAKLAVWFASLPEPVRQGIVGFVLWGTVIGKITGLLGPLISVVGNVAPAVGKVAGAIVTGAGKWGLLGRGAQDAAKLADGGIGKILAAMTRGAGGMMVRAASMAASWLVAMGPIGWIIAGVAILVGLIIYYWDDIKAFTIACWQAIGVALMAAWAWIKQIAIDAVVWVVTTVLGWWNTANAYAEAAHAALVAIITGAWDWVKNLVVGAITWVVTTVLGWWNTANAYAEAAHAALVALISNAWSSIVSTVSGWISTVVSFLSSCWSSISSAASTAWNWLVNLIVSVGASIVSTVSGWASNVINFLSNAWSNVRSTASSAWSSIVSTIQSAGSNAVSFVASLPGRFLSALSRLGSLLVGVGGDLVRGLWNGIAAGWSWLTSMVSNLASSLLNAAKSALGIGSPSKEFRDEVGRWIPEGFGGGVIRNASVATDAVRAMAADAVAAAQSEAMRGAAMAVSLGASTGPRTLARAGSASASAGSAASETTDRSMNIVINNPLPEKSSASLNRSARTTAKLGKD